MYAVIFKAVIAELDQSYYETAKVLRSRAKELYGCIAFESYQEGEEEVSISYWQDEAQIDRWKKDPVHMQAQQLGRERWYRSYRVEVVKLLKRYEHPLDHD